MPTMWPPCPDLLWPVMRLRRVRKTILRSLRCLIPASMFCPRDFPRAITESCFVGLYYAPRYSISAVSMGRELQSRASFGKRHQFTTLQALAGSREGAEGFVAMFLY